jgi:DNA sulfur modification protein DndD
MKIEKLVLHNFRQYKDLNLSLSNDNLCIAIGKMGMGKSNLMNAINWCLYGKEPFLSSDSGGLPLLNLKTIYESQDGDIKDTTVEIWIKTEHERIIFSRTAKYRIKKTNSNLLPTPTNQPELQVKVSEGGGYELKENNIAIDYVERFVPSGISEYFFFDGERLNRYFKEKRNIKSSIYEISQTQLLTDVEKRLFTIIKELNKEISNNNPGIEEAFKNLEKTQQNVDNKKIEIEKCKEQINTAKNEIDRIQSEISGLPDVSEVQDQIEALSQRKKKKLAKQDEKIEKKNNLLFDYTKYIVTYPAIKNAITLVQEKKKKKELPPTGDIELIKTILNETRECICGTKIDSGSEHENRLKQIISKNEITSEVGRELQVAEHYLYSMNKKVKIFKDTIFSITQDINDLEEEIAGLVNDISKKESQIGGLGSEDQDFIDKLYSQKKKYEQQRDDETENLGRYQQDLEKLTDDLNEAEKKFNREKRKSNEYKRLGKQIDFTKKAHSIVVEIKRDVMDQIRDEITVETNNRFMELHWKSQTYKEVIINDDFEFDVIHRMGYSSLASLSGGERCVLALAFTMALHKVSGFDFPIFIDRPLAMASGEALGHIAEVLTKLSENKQIILFLTPEDNSSVDEYWNHVDHISKYTLQMGKDEMDTNWEVVRNV